VCRKVCRNSIGLRQIRYLRILIQSRTNDFKLGMLVLQCSLHIPVTHRSHDGCTISGPL
jgi:hypothetical protein